MALTELWLVRHGESVGNIAASSAQKAGQDVIELDYRDADVPLSADGERQAAALGDWLREVGEKVRAFSVVSSPYRRAKETIGIALADAGCETEVRVDARLRDRELGILDLLTAQGVVNRFPEEHARRAWLGRLYYRPPGGESWLDVALRLESFLAAEEARAGGGRLLIATHDAVIMLFIYVCCGFDEQQLLDFTATHSVTNASVTRLSREAGTDVWRLDRFAATEHIEQSDAPVTEHSGDEDTEGEQTEGEQTEDEQTEDEQTGETNE